MAYQNLTLRNIAGEITATFNDGSFRSLTPPDPSIGATAAFIGTASTGVSHEFFRHVDMSRTFTEFGADSEIAKMVQTAKASDNQLPVIVSRIGARPSSLTVKRLIENSAEKENLLQIVPKFLQEASDRRVETLSALKMILLPYTEGSLVRQRLILGLVSPSGTTTPVYDSERLVVADGEAIFDVSLNLGVGEVLFTDKGLRQADRQAVKLNFSGSGTVDWSSQTQSVRLSLLADMNSIVNFDWANAQLLSGDVLGDVRLLKLYNSDTPSSNALSGDSDISLSRIVGEANKDLSNKSERYVGTDLAYKNLEFEDVGFLYCEGCHADTECVELDELKDAPAREQLAWPLSKLGNLFKYEYNGEEYSYMFGHRNPFESSHVASSYTHDFDDPGARATASTLGFGGIVFNKDAIGAAGHNGDTVDLIVGAGVNNGNDGKCKVTISGNAAASVITVSPDTSGATVSITKGQLVEMFNGGDAPATVQLVETFLLEDLDISASVSSSESGEDVETRATAVVAFADGRDADTIEATFNMSDEHKKLGDLLNLVEFHLDNSADDNGAALAVESFPNEKGMIECHVKYNASTIVAATIFHTPFANINFDKAHDTFIPSVKKHRLRPTMIGAGTLSSTLSTNLRIQDKIKNSNEDYDKNDPIVMTHYDLTGQFVPEGVLARLIDFEDLEGADILTTGSSATLKAAPAEIREVSFLQQAAQAAYTASTNYSQTIAVVPTSAPSNSDRGLSRWAGQAPTYEVDSNGTLKVIENGTGLLGNKFLAGRIGYRNDEGFGGIMLTEGNDLPNEKPYGVDQDDEALDQFGEPIDLGKHVVVVGAYGIVPDPESISRRNRTNQTNSVYTNAGPKICAMLNALPPGSEPIGQVNGLVGGMIPRHRTSMATLNNLALIRVCMIDQNAVISSIYTAAAPSSDYRKISSVMSANAILGRLRSLCMPFIGRPFKDEEIASLNQSIDGTMRSMVNEDYAQRIDVSLSASRLDRINGILRASVTFVPPLSIEAITVEITLEPPAAGI